MSSAYPQRLAAEALGSALLAATVVGSGIMAAALANGNDALALLANALATGAMLAVLITMLGPVSGAHLNPAVTLVAALRRDHPWVELIGYWAAQIAGMIVGVAVAHAMFAMPIAESSAKVRAGLPQMLSEAVATFGLIVTILGTMRCRPRWVAPSVALYIVAAYWFTASTSFANPAITLARAMTASFAGIRIWDVPAFVAAQLAGAMLALPVAQFLFESTPECCPRVESA